ncbi:transcription antitermination factor NusB [Spiroplasma endosymbiont of Polydrusus pterygomalis]|uniref:transcription antitermination factor NusB n=1 Tax=Spiroplasma endosymbiont of Polydrusus pterygomalis TaxID=3139327 RepID=UPI003CCA9609
MLEQKKITQHHKRIGMMEVLYQYFVAGQTQQAFRQFLFEEEGKTLINEQYEILNKIIDYEYDLINLINANLKPGWDFESLKPIEQAILILAVYEIVHTKTDKKIVINEAIIITKAYCPNDAYKYINGVLDKINK